MIEKFLGQKKELFIYGSHVLMRAIDTLPKPSHNFLLLFYSIEDEQYNIFPMYDVSLIDETVESEYFSDRSYSHIRINQKQEHKMLSLLSLDVDILTIIYSMFIDGKEDEFKWIKYGR